MQNEFMAVTVTIKDAEILEKLEILRLERGISTHNFMVRAIAEKLIRAGYLQKVTPHAKKEKDKTPSLLDSLRNIEFQSMKKHKEGGL